MTEAHEPNDIDGPHEGPIKTPKQLILAILYAFLVPIFGIILLVMFVSSRERPAAGSDALTPAATVARIQRVGHVDIKDASDLSSMKTGEQVFGAQCTACHSAGLLGSPKFGDADAWAPRIKTGFDSLLHSALAGKGQMPPQGGGDFSDFEIARAVVYMADKGGAAFPEPPMPAPAAPSGGASGVVAMAAAAMAGEASAPRGEPNAGTPIALPTSGLNAQVRNDVPNAVPGNQPAAQTTVAAANTGTAPTAAAGTAPALFAQVCSACHATGVAGAPRVGDKVAWAPRIAQGIDALTASAIKGKGAMPPKGGSNASEGEIRTVVTYMVNAAK